MKKFYTKKDFFPADRHRKGKIPVKYFFAPGKRSSCVIFAMGKKGSKSRKLSKIIMLTKMHIHKQTGLWKTLVENPVENVENLGFSTVIFAFSQFVEGWRNYAYALA